MAELICQPRSIQSRSALRFREAGNRRGVLVTTLGHEQRRSKHASVTLTRWLVRKLSTGDIAKTPLHPGLFVEHCTSRRLEAGGSSGSDSSRWVSAA